MTILLHCSCESGYQDKAYGLHMRLHNFAPKKCGNGGWICTVCGKAKPK